VGFFAHLWLIWHLRLTVAANRLRSASGAVPALLGLLLLAALAVALGWASFSLLAHPAVAASPRYSKFLLRLVCFLVSVVFVVWPVLSAGVDEHTELSRFSTFPIRPFRLFVASTVSAFFEPRSLVFYPIVFGAMLGYAAQRPYPLWIGVGLAGAYLLMNVAWGRAGLTLVLNVLRHRRSAEILGLFFIGALFLATLAPPVDASWIYSLLRAGPEGAVGAIDERMIIGASRAIAGTPPGGLAKGIEYAANGRSLYAVFEIFALMFWANIGLAVSFWLLVRFYKGTARPAPPARDRKWNGRAARDGALQALLDREASDWVRNPKARLLVSVPFFLCILLKLVSARDLAAAFLGGAVDAWLLTVLCSYAGLVVGANFAQNVFAYDGPGLALLYAAPVPLRLVMAAKNAVHAAGALLVALFLTGFYGLYVFPAGPASMAAGLFALAGQIPVLLAAGNFLSVLAPRKFHASLRRRDRPPPVATFAGLFSAAAAIAPSTLVLRLLGGEEPGAGTLGALLLVAAIAWFGYLKLLPRACALLESRREVVLRQVMRE